jgi:hypothetical protein
MPEEDCVRPPGNRYPLRSFPERLLYAGHLPDGPQILVGPLPPGARVLRFAPTGELAAVERHARPPPRDVSDLERAIVACFERLGAAPGTIRVRRFSSGDPGSLLAGVERRDDPRGYVRVEITDLHTDDLDEAGASCGWRPGRTSWSGGTPTTSARTGRSSAPEVVGRIPRCRRPWGQVGSPLA